jgi:predicted transcriptional regulator
VPTTASQRPNRTSPESERVDALVPEIPYRGLPGASLTVLPPSPFSRTLKVMEVHFTPEQQAQLAQIASKAGTKPEQLVTDVVARYLDEKARFLAAAEKGIAAAERGEFIEEEEMDARLERMFQS